MSKSLKSKSTAQLRADIKTLVNELNQNLFEYYDTGETVDIFENAIDTVKSKAKAKRLNKGGLPMGWNLTKKSDLIAYHQELQRLKNFDQFTPAAINRQENINQKIKSKFMKNHPGFSDKEYDTMINLYEKLEPKLVEYIKGSAQIVKIMEKAREYGVKSEQIYDIINKKLQYAEKHNLDQDRVVSNIMNGIRTTGRRNK